MNLYVKALVGNLICESYTCINYTIGSKIMNSVPSPSFVSTLIPAVNPISYAMMGLLPQMNRNEIVKVVSLLLKVAYGIDYMPINIPNKYLKN